MPTDFSRRSHFDPSPNALTRALEARAKAGEPVLDLTASNPTRAEIPYPSDLVDALAHPGAALYEPTAFGLARAREAAAACLHEEQGLKVSPERVALTASTSEAYAFLFKVLCDPGDEALVPAPSYPLFEHLARYEGVRVVPYPLAYDGAWHIDLDAVRERRTPRTRALLVVSPNNPTGSYLKRTELAALASLGVPLVADEVFTSYPLAADPTCRRARTALEANDALVFSLGGLSKMAALPQMKLAWIAAGGPGADEAMARLELVADTFLSVGAPVQHALPQLLATRHVAAAAIRARARENLSYLQVALTSSAATVLHVEGGWYATVRLPDTRTEESWLLDLLGEHGVLTHPGAFFDFAAEPFLVLSLLTPHAVFAEGVQRLLALVDR